MMRFLVADDHYLFREGFIHFLTRHFPETHTEAAATFEEVKQQLAQENFHLIFLDLKMPGGDGIFGIRDICELANHTPVIVVSAEENVSVIHACLKTGVSAYIPKSSEKTTMKNAIQEVLRGGSYFPRAALNPDRSMELILRMSVKKRSMLRLLAEGKSNKQIAAELFLSEGTVRQYVSEILRDFQVDNRTQAGIKARELLRTDNNIFPL